jgi:hypothetical protein
MGSEVLDFRVIDYRKEALRRRSSAVESSAVRNASSLISERKTSLAVTNVVRVVLSRRTPSWVAS